jgi:hypothetical protein
VPSKELRSGLSNTLPNEIGDLSSLKVYEIW